MNNSTKLQIFTFSDRFNWSFLDVQTEAFNAALRRAEIMGWSDIRLVPVSLTPKIQNDVRNYEFEIWGAGEAVLESSQESESALSPVETFRNVARDTEL